MAQNSSKPITYADAGVDIDRADRAKQRIKYLAQKTFNRNVLSEIGGFGGFFASTGLAGSRAGLERDGVGTKLKVAFELDVHHTVGADLVNHCVNDIAVQGATPLFFLDYLATGKLDPDVVRRLSRAWPMPAATTVARSSAAKPPRCPASMPTASTTWPASSSARSIGTR